MRQADDPIPPENVRIRLLDGTIIPIELVYAGIDDEGHHMWKRVSPAELPDVGLDRLLIDVLPPNTGVQV
jgi:hypothetical protein